MTRVETGSNPELQTGLSYGPTFWNLLWMMRTPGVIFATQPARASAGIQSGKTESRGLGFSNERIGDDFFDYGHDPVSIIRGARRRF